jgi:hypothetical protein
MFFKRVRDSVLKRRHLARLAADPVNSNALSAHAKRPPEDAAGYSKGVYTPNSPRGD